MSIADRSGHRRSLAAGAHLRVVNWHNTPQRGRARLRAELTAYLRDHDPVGPDDLDRATAAADELGPGDYAGGGIGLERKVAHFRPKVLAILGITAYRAAFGRPRARMGLQEEVMAGSAIWVLPNPSGRNGHFSVEPFRELRRAVR